MRTIIIVEVTKGYRSNNMLCVIRAEYLIAVVNRNKLGKMAYAQGTYGNKLLLLF